MADKPKDNNAEEMVQVSIPARLLGPMREDFESKTAQKITRDYRMALEIATFRKARHDDMIETAKTMFAYDDDAIEASENLNPQLVQPRGDKTWAEVRADVD